MIKQKLPSTLNIQFKIYPKTICISCRQEFANLVNQQNLKDRSVLFDPDYLVLFLFPLSVDGDGGGAEFNLKQLCVKIFGQFFEFLKYAKRHNAKIGQK